MKGYHEYLELYGYFARSGEPKLSRADYDLLHAEYTALVQQHPALTADELSRLKELKQALFRDKP